uniref:Uncharacterized protein n=1 Tax=Arundo donax TaxID=35708 RepID=A0A0A9BKU1_ARUDO
MFPVDIILNNCYIFLFDFMVKDFSVLGLRA